MTSNDTKAAREKAAEIPSNLYKTLFFVTAPITAILAGVCVWMGVQLASTSPASQATPAATPTAAAAPSPDSFCALASSCSSKEYEGVVAMRSARRVDSLRVGTSV